MEVLFPFKCEYCDRLFCSYHKLPENHQCPSLPKKPTPFIEARIPRSKPKPERTIVSPAPREATFKPMSEGSTESVKPSHERENTEKIRSKHSGMPKKLKITIVVLCAMLVVVPFVAAFGSYTLGFNNGSDSGYNHGHEVGYQSGNSSGYQLGYSGGYSQGNDTGYGNGYMIGYENGNSSGYQQGHELGWIQGNSSGFSEGYSNGNASGYANGYQSGYNYGNSSGYESGYQIGYASGNSSGYTVGFSQGYSEGNLTGYGIGYQSGQISGSQSGYSQGYSNGNAVGYETGYLQGVKDGAGRGYNVRDPTYQEMMGFIAVDKTNLNTYHYPDYVCWNFAADTINNAFKNGYRCGFVYIGFTDGYAHAVICLNTTDHGLIFIEPQNDAIVQIAVGSYYTYTGETIARYGIIW
ncbi:hypothetical protein MUO69_06115 [Candidatus Bathyarchaeota archaeon]|nr:hypothetical protein [Candidatus Bathyarchaeota archaeon]